MFASADPASKAKWCRKISFLVGGAAALVLALTGCGQSPIRSGYVSYVWYDAGPNDLRQIDASKIPGSDPYVRLYPGYLEVIYTQPNTHQRADYIVPAASLRVLRWR
jgi:hypothetical protein